MVHALSLAETVLCCLNPGILSTNMPLSISQKKVLKGLAHSLKPVVMIGQNGLTENLLASFDEALTYHQLIKIKLAGDKQIREELITALTKHAKKAEIVQQIGGIVVMYQRNPKKPNLLQQQPN